MQNVGPLDIKRIGSFYPEIIFAVIAVAAFWLTIGQPETVAPVGQEKSKDKHEIGFSPDVVKQAMTLAPGQLLLSGQSELAVKKANELSARQPFDVLANICAGNVLVACACVEDGLRLLKKAVALAPRSRFIRMNLAEKLALSKRYEEAIVQLNLIAKGSPRWTQPHLVLAQIYLTTNKPSLASVEFAHVLESDPTNGQIRKQQALALAYNGQDRQALDEYMQGEADELTFAGMPSDLKLAVANWGSLARAEYQCRRELEADPDDALVKYRLSRILAYTGRMDECRKLLFEAAKKAPYNVDIHRYLAVVLQKAGESNMAVAEFRRSVYLEKTAAKKNPDEQQ